jgi:hypothetical protein
MKDLFFLAKYIYFLKEKCRAWSNWLENECVGALDRGFPTSKHIRKVELGTRWK